MSQNNGRKAMPFQVDMPDFMRRTSDDVAQELRQLREEIKELREALAPPKSILIVGPDVERILRGLK